MPVPQGSSSTGSGDRRRLIEPTGYAVTSFISSVGLTAGIGLAPDGLLLFVAAVILSVIEWRRLVAMNPWLSLESPEDFRTHEGRILMKYSAWGTGVLIALSISALVLVRAQDNDAAAIGPALIAGVVTLVLNYLIKREIARPRAPLDTSPRMGNGAGLADGSRDDRESGDDGDGDRETSRWTGNADDAGPHVPYVPFEPRDDDEDDAQHPRNLGPRALEDAADQRRAGKRSAPANEPDPSFDSTPASYAGDADDPTDGFREQDDRALHGARLEERPQKAAAKRARRKDRKRDDA